MFAQHRFAVIGPQLVTDRRRAAALPENGRSNGMMGGATPCHHGLALVGDRHAFHTTLMLRGPGETLVNHSENALPKCDGVLFNPAGMWSLNGDGH